MAAATTKPKPAPEVEAARSAFENANREMRAKVAQYVEMLYSFAMDAITAIDSGDRNAAQAAWKPEMSFLARQNGETDIDNMYGRQSVDAWMIGIIRQMNTYGCEADLKADQEKLAATQRAEAERVPKIKAEIEALQAQISKLVSERAEVERRVDDRLKARDYLRRRETLPKPLRDNLDQAIDCATSSLRGQISLARGTVSRIDAALSKEFDPELAEKKTKLQDRVDTLHEQLDEVGRKAELEGERNFWLRWIEERRNSKS